MKQPWNACRIWSRLGYSGRKAVVFLPLEISLGVVLNTAISRKVVVKSVHASIPKGNMGYDQYTVPDTVAVEPTFVALL